MNDLCAIGLLSLFQRERTKVRDCSECDFRALTKSPQARFRDLHALDCSKTEAQQYLVWLEIPIASDRASPADANHAPNHLVQPQASWWDNRNPERKGRWDAAAGICNLQSVDFGGGATKCARNRSHFYGGNERASQRHSLTIIISFREKRLTPHLDPLPRSGERRKRFSSY